MANHKESSSHGIANCDEMTLVLGMIGICKGCGQGILEHGDGFVEGHAMLLGISSSLLAIPLEAHRTILSRGVAWVRLPRGRVGQSRRSHADGCSSPLGLLVSTLDALRYAVSAITNRGFAPFSARSPAMLLASLLVCIVIGIKFTLNVHVRTNRRDTSKLTSDMGFQE